MMNVVVFNVGGVFLFYIVNESNLLYFTHVV